MELPIPRSDEQWREQLQHDETLERARIEAEVQKHRATLEIQARSAANRRHTTKVIVAILAGLLVVLGCGGALFITEFSEVRDKREMSKECIESGRIWEDRAQDGHTCSK